jgi:CBS domain-containing protein
MYCPACGHQNEPGSDACTNCMLSLSHLGASSAHDRLEENLSSEPVSSLKPREPVVVSVQANLGTAIRAMIDRGVGAVLVVEDGTLAGILTERDFLTKVAGSPDHAAMNVREFMTRDPECVGPTDTLAFALGKMDAGGYRHLPVVQNGQPVGVVSVRDILRHVALLCRNS